MRYMLVDGHEISLCGRRSPAAFYRYRKRMVLSGDAGTGARRILSPTMTTVWYRSRRFPTFWWNGSTTGARPPIFRPQHGRGRRHVPIITRGFLEELMEHISTRFSHRRHHYGPGGIRAYATGRGRITVLGPTEEERMGATRCVRNQVTRRAHRKYRRPVKDKRIEGISM